MDEKLLRVVAPHFVAGAIFQKDSGDWKVARAAPIIQYFERMSPEEIKAYVLKKGWAYSWL